jgi:putative ABC transport system permease protein
MGAGRGRLIRQMLTESVLLSAAGGLAGMLLSLWGVQALRALSPAGTPRLDEVGIDATALGFAALLAVLTGIAFGIVPALQLSRAELSLTLRETGGLRAGTGSRRTRNALVVAEVALALMLLAGAGLMLRSFVRLQNVDPGFNADNVLTANLLLPRARYDDAASIARFYGTLVDRVAAEPGVVSAGASTVIPLVPGGGDSDTGFAIEGRPAPAAADRAPVTWYRSVTTDYFRTMGIRIVQGRPFAPTDRADAPGVVLINRTLAELHWPGESPVGQRVRIGPNDPPREIVGVIGDVKQRGVDQQAVPEMYFPLEQLPARRLTVVLRTAGPPLELAPQLRSVVRDLDAELPVAFVGSMDDLLSQSVAMPRLFLTFFAFFALVAMLLASVGIYGVTAFAVNQRRQEIGIRMALGAKQADVLGLVVRQAMRLVLVGVCVGLVGALLLSRTLTSLLFELSPTDPLTFALIVVVLSGVAFVASWVPARRAAAQDPLAALRME